MKKLILFVELIPLMVLILLPIILFVYDFLFNLDLICFPGYELPSLQILTAIGTLGAVIVALFLPTYTKYKNNIDLKDKIKVNLSQEIFLNLYSIYKSGLMEIKIDNDQYKLFKSNLNLFSLGVISKNKGIRQIYNLFALYEFQWRKESPIYTHKMYEYKFRIKVEIYLFLELLRKDDFLVRELLSQYLLGKIHLKQIPVKYTFKEGNNIYEFLKLKESNQEVLLQRLNLKMGSNLTEFEKLDRIDADRQLTISFFEEYFDTKYKPEFEKIEEDLNSMFTKLN
jgi:hypothetical protein